MFDNTFDDDEMAQFYTRRTPQTAPTVGLAAPQAQRREPSATPAPAGEAGQETAPPATAVTPPTTEAPTTEAPTAAAGNEARLCGFLFSVSRDGKGECWQLREGANTIGSSPDNDVWLQEGTVAPAHAVLNIEDAEKGLQVTACDLNTGHGTLLNGLKLDSKPTRCHDRDTLTVGECYELLLLLADSKKYGLREKDNFREPGADDDSATQDCAEEEEGTVFGGDALFDDDATRIV